MHRVPAEIYLEKTFREILGDDAPWVQPALKKALSTGLQEQGWPRQNLDEVGIRLLLGYVPMGSLDSF
jgi:hypothetical protein